MNRIACAIASLMVICSAAVAQSQSDSGADLVGLAIGLYSTQVKESCALGDPDPVEFAAAEMRDFGKSFMSPAQIRRKNELLVLAIDSVKKSGGCASIEPKTLETFRRINRETVDSTRAAANIQPPLGLRWGATEEQILAATETPLKSLSGRADYVSMLSGSTSAIGREGTVTLYVDRTNGLVQAVMNFPMQVTDDCESVEKQLAAAIANRYGAIEPIVVRENATASLDICDAISIGEGKLGHVWAGSPKGYSITLMIIGSSSAAILYSSPESGRTTTILKWVAARKVF